MKRDGQLYRRQWYHDASEANAIAIDERIAEWKKQAPDAAKELQKASGALAIELLVEMCMKVYQQGALDTANMVDVFLDGTCNGRFAISHSESASAPPGDVAE